MKRAAGMIAGLAAASAAHAAEDPAFRGIEDLSRAMATGQATSERLTKAYLARIAALDRKGPKLNSIIVLNPGALAEARRLDAERKSGTVRGPLHGVPILLKDNIESADGTATTAGSLALAGNVTNRDAPLVKRLTDAGAVILGKTNLSEWANYRSSRSISGWSAMGGLVRNPYALDRSACGSSAGSGAAVAAGLAAAAIGTETDGSITCPAAMNGVVGLKPTVGLVSRTHIVPISASQDTAGPMTRNVADAAAVLTAIAGSDPADPATAEADRRRTDYLKALDAASLKGARIGVMRAIAGRSPQTDAVFEQALAALKAQGAVLVEVTAPDGKVLDDLEDLILRVEFKAGVNAYLASTSPDKVKARTLADLIAFNAAEPRETVLFGQDTFEEAQASPGLDDPAYRKAKADARRLAGRGGLSAPDRAHGLCGGPAGGSVLHRNRLVGGPAAVPGLCLRAGDPGPARAHLPGFGQRLTRLRSVAAGSDEGSMDLPS